MKKTEVTLEQAKAIKDYVRIMAGIGFVIGIIIGMCI